jgi:hypothetical protein
LRLNNNSQIRKKIFVPPLPQMTQESNWSVTLPALSVIIMKFKYEVIFKMQPVVCITVMWSDCKCR